MKFVSTLLVALAASTSSALQLPLGGARVAPTLVCTTSSPFPAAAALPVRAARAGASRMPVGSVRMGLFGLGAPELAVIAAVALFILGPEQMKKMAKDVGKISAELKQVPEEFSKGMEVGNAELEAKKKDAPALESDDKPAA